MKKVIKIIAVLLVVGIVALMYLDHRRSRAEIDTLQRLVKNLEKRIPDSPTPPRQNPVMPPKPTSTTTAIDQQPPISKADDGHATQGFTLKDFKNAGRATPQAAFETLAWASGSGDIEQLQKLIALQPGSREKLEAILESLSPEDRKKFPSLEAIPAMGFALEGLIKHTDSHVYEIENETMMPDGTVQINYANVTGANRVEKNITMQLSNDGWQVVIPSEVIDRIPTLLADPLKLQMLLRGTQLSSMRAWTDRK